MAITRRKTTVLLGGIATVFVIVLIVLCLSPSKPPKSFYEHPPQKDLSYGDKMESTTSETTTSTMSTSTSEITTTTTPAITTTTTPAITTTTTPAITTTTTPAITTTTPKDIAITDSSTETSTTTTTTSSSTTTPEEVYAETTEPILNTTTESTITERVESTTDRVVILETTTRRETEETTTDAKVEESTSMKEEPTTTETSTVAETASTEVQTEEITTRETTPQLVDTTSTITTPLYETESTVGETTIEITESTVDGTTIKSTESTIGETTIESTESTIGETTIESTKSTLDATTTVPTESTIGETTVVTTETTTDATTETSTPVKESCVPQKEECSTADCKVLSSRMLGMMNHTASPCDDFYEYACGGVEDNPFILPEDPEVLVFNRITGMFKAPSKMSEESLPAREFYQSCLNRSSDLSLEELTVLTEMGRNLSEFGGEDDSNYRPDDWLAHFMLHDYAPFFEVSLDAEKSEHQFQLRISLPVRRFDTEFSEFFDTVYCKNKYTQTVNDAIVNGIPSLDISEEYSKYTNCLKEGLWISALTNQIKQVNRVLNITGHFQDRGVGLDYLGDKLFDLEFFFKDLREEWPVGSEIRKDFMTKEFTEVEVAQLNTLFPLKNFDWHRFLRTVIGKDAFKVQLYHAKHLTQIFKTLESYEQNLKSFFLLLWYSHLYTNLVTPLTSQAGPQYCMKLTKYLVPDMVAETYLNSFTEHEHHVMSSQAREVANKVKITIEDALEDEFEIPDGLKEKLKWSQVSVGGESSLMELRKDMKSTQHELELGESYILNSLELLKRRRKKLYSLKELNAAENIPLWTYFNTPYSTSPRIIYATNTILIPEGALSPPFMYPEANLPDYILYAGLGSVISHEMMHAIDTAGLKFGNYAAENSHFSKSQQMKNRVQSVQRILYMKQFHLMVGSNKDYVSLDFKLPKTLHLNEVIADIEATRLAWLSYTNRHKAGGFKDEPYIDYDSERKRRSLAHDAPIDISSDELPLVWMDRTPLQIFYLKMAQNHCARKSYLDIVELMEFEHLPPRLRVNIALAYEPLFAKAFNCDANAKHAMVLPESLVSKFFVNDLNKEPN